MDVYREETTWTIRIEAEARFDDDYDGDMDGYAWRERFHREVQPRIMAALFRELNALPEWKVRPGNRGLSSHDEVLVHLELETK
jgi:hypothetical protein